MLGRGTPKRGRRIDSGRAGMQREQEGVPEADITVDTSTSGAARSTILLLGRFFFFFKTHNASKGAP